MRRQRPGLEWRREAAPAARGTEEAEAAACACTVAAADPRERGTVAAEPKRGRDRGGGKGEREGRRSLGGGRRRRKGSDGGIR